MPICTKCTLDKPLDQFRKDRRRPSTSICSQCCARLNKARRRTPEGFILKAYRDLTRRCMGTTGLRKTDRLYKGLAYCSKSDFISWSRANIEFWRLHRLWVASDYNLKLAPTVNRINPDLGYLLGNLEWMTFALNCSLARHQGDAALQRIFSASA